MQVFVQPVADAFGTDFQLSFNVARNGSQGPSTITVLRTFDILESDDNPTALSFTNLDVAETDGSILVGQMTGTDPDQHSALTYTLVFDPTGQFSINFDRLFATGGLDYEALDATGLYTKDGSGRLEIDLVIRVTDPDGNFTDFTRTVRVSDVAENLVTTGTTGDDLVDGTLLADIINGGAGEDVVLGRAGNDVIRGQGDDDIIKGNGDNDVLSGGAGDDIVKGGTGNARVDGNGGDDFLFGGADNDRVNGGTGDDYLRDGTGVDRMTGGAGADMFVFVADTTLDYVTDFEDGVDLIRFGGTSDFSDLTITSTVVGRVIIRDGAEKLVVFDEAGVLTAADITEDDFIF